MTRLNLEVGNLRRKRAQEQKYHSTTNHAHGRVLALAQSIVQTRDTRASGGRAARPVGDRLMRRSNFWRMLEILFSRWSWLTLACVVCGLAAFLAGLMLTKYTAAVSLIRRENRTPSPLAAERTPLRKRT